MLQTIWEAICTLLCCLWQIVAAFWTYLGVGEAIAKYAIYIAIIVLLALDPFGVSKRDKRMARKTADVIVNTAKHLRK